MSQATHYPAAFINIIADEGTKAEAIQYLQKTWNELQDMRAQYAAMTAAMSRIANTDVGQWKHCKENGPLLHMKEIARAALKAAKGEA